MTKSQRSGQALGDKLALASRSFVVEETHQQRYQLDNFPDIMEDNSDETVDSLVMARRLLTCHHSSRKTMAEDTEFLQQSSLEQSQELLMQSIKDFFGQGSSQDVFVSPVKVSQPALQSSATFQSPHVVIAKDKLHTASSNSPNGVMDGPYGEQFIPYGNDSLDLADVAMSPVKSPRRSLRRSTSTTSPSPRRRSRISSRDVKNETILVVSPRRTSKTTRASASASNRRGLVARRSTTTSSLPQATGIQALQAAAGEQCIVFPNFQDSFVSGSSTDNTPCPAFHDSVFSLSQQDNMLLLRDDTDSEDEHQLRSHDNEQTTHQSATSGRSSPVRRRSSRQFRAPPLTKRSGSRQLSSSEELTSELTVPVSPRRTSLHRPSKRPPTPPTRTSTILQHRKLQQQQLPSSAPVTRYEMERRHMLASELFAEMKTSAAERRRRRHSSIEQVILAKQKCNPRRREADIFGQALNDTDSFNDSFTDLIRRRRANVDDH